MYKFIVLVCSAMLLSYVLARPQDQRAAAAPTSTTTAATIVKQDNVNNADGSFNSRLVKWIKILNIFGVINVEDFEKGFSMILI